VSVDPLQFKYPHYTPYQYAGNKPISYIDLDGLEEAKKEDNLNTVKGFKSETDRNLADQYINQATELKQGYESKVKEGEKEISKLETIKNPSKKQQNLLESKRDELFTNKTAIGKFEKFISAIEGMKSDTKYFYEFNQSNAIQNQAYYLEAYKKTGENKHENTTIVIPYPKGNGMGLPFHEMQHAIEVFNGFMEPEFKPGKSKAEKFTHLKGSTWGLSEQNAYQMQFFTDDRSLPNFPAFGKYEDINIDYIQTIKNTQGRLMYPGIE